MVSALEWVLVGIVAYAVVVMVLRARGILPEYVKGSGPIVTIHTKRGKAFLGWLARPKRFWRAWGNLGIGIGIVVMIGTLLITLFSAYQSIVDPQPTALTEPRNALVIPGLNDFLPLSAAPEIVAGLAIALVVHEGGHGLFCRVGNIDIESMGLVFLSFIPIGAFVAPDEESVSKAERGDQTRMFTAGVMNNFAIGLLALVLLFGPVLGAVSVVAGVPIGDTVPGSPADQSAIDSGDVITSVEGQEVANASAFRDALATTEPSVDVGLKSGESATIERRVYVNAHASSAPVSTNQTITAVNGTEVRTVRAFADALQNRTVVTLSRENASGVTTAIGAYTRVQANGSFAAAGGPPGEVVFVTHADGERVLTWTALERVIDGTSAGEDIDLVGYVDGERTEFTVELGAGEGAREQLGVRTAGGPSGFGVDDLGIDEYPAGAFLDILGGNGGGESGYATLPFLAQTALMLFLPFIGLTAVFNYGFPGFTGIATNFYTVDGALGLLGTGGAFLVVNVLFWTAWINLVVGQFNLFPTYPLDGGHIVRTMTESFVSRLPIENGRRVTTAVTVAISIVVLAAMAMLFIGPQLLA